MIYKLSGRILGVNEGLAAENQHVRCIKWHLVTQDVIDSHADAAVSAAGAWAVHTCEWQRGLYPTIIIPELLGPPIEIVLPVGFTTQACEIDQAVLLTILPFVAKIKARMLFEVPALVEDCTVQIPR
mmetsp:Transcript_10054/g.17366  ORF Transcript_10054/g.17366 Transcript_10054/m.17366 type:complete len:127 (-) Transcript_10054:362-742(-)